MFFHRSSIFKASLGAVRSDRTTQRLDFHGPMVNRSARIADTGFGGQVVISGTAKSFIKDGQLDYFVNKYGQPPQFISRGSFTLKVLSCLSLLSAHSVTLIMFFCTGCSRAGGSIGSCAF